MIKNKCLRCGYEWVSRIEKPKVCARCKTHYWEIFKDGKCEICGKTFQVLNIHHINGNHSDNRKSNKITICSFCHEAIHHGIGGKNKIRNYIMLKNSSEINNKLKFYQKKLKWK